MKILPLAAILSALLTGCVTAPVLDRAPVEPLEGWIVPLEMAGIDDHGVRFFLNRPAHAALFRVRSGGGVELIHPRLHGQSRLHHAGANIAFLPRRTDLAVLPGLPSFASFGPTHYILIASEEPIDLGAMAASPFAIERALGMHTYLSGNPYAVAESLTRHFGQSPSAGHHVDIYAHWPHERAARSVLVRNDLRIVRCADGTVDIVQLRRPACLDELQWVRRQNVRDTPSDTEVEIARREAAPEARERADRLRRILEVADRPPPDDGRLAARERDARHPRARSSDTPPPSRGVRDEVRPRPSGSATSGEGRRHPAPAPRPARDAPPPRPASSGEGLPRPGRDGDRPSDD